MIGAYERTESGNIGAGAPRERFIAQTFELVCTGLN